MKGITSDSSGGALLFAIITSFVISFISAALVTLTMNQYSIINDEVKRKEAYYWARAGMEYANYKLRTDTSLRSSLANPDDSVTWDNDTPLPSDLSSRVNSITIKKLASDDISDYEINVHVAN